MKKFWPIRGLRKRDEMERYIIFKAQRNAYLFLVAGLIIWSFYESWQVYSRQGSLNPAPSFLLSMALLIQAFSQLLLTRNAVKDDEDSWESGPLLKIIMLACGAAIVIAAVTNAIVLLGVRL